MPCETFCQNLDHYIQIICQNLDSQHQESLVIILSILSIFLIEILRSLFLVYNANYKNFLKIFRNILNQQGLNQRIVIREIQSIFQFSQCKFSYLVKKITMPWYNAVSYSETEKLFFSAAVKDNFNMPAGDKSHPWVLQVLKIINFTNCRT